MNKLLSRCLLWAAVAGAALAGPLPVVAAPANVRTGFESLALPDGFKKEGGMLNRIAAKASMDLSAQAVGATLGAKVEMWRQAPADGGPSAFADVRSAVQGQGWAASQPTPSETWLWIDKGGARLMLFYFVAKDGAWVYLCDAGAAPPAGSAVVAAAPSPAPIAAAATRATAPAHSPAAAAAEGPRLPTGETPRMYPGSPGWLPSGRGVPIPAASLTGGRPQGLWFYMGLNSSSGMSAVPVVFLPDGSMASNPRPGAGDLVDIAGQSAQPGSNGVGRFSVGGGRINVSSNGFDSSDAYSTGSDGEGPWFASGARRYRPLKPIDAQQLVGKWSAVGSSFVFHADGRYESGQTAVNSAYTLAAGGRGRWQLDGYLIGMRPDNAPFWITTIGASSPGLMVMGSALYKRQ